MGGSKDCHPFLEIDMSRFSELRKSLLDMSPDELREQIRRIRAERRVSREKPSTKRKAKIKSNRSASRVVNMIHTLTPEQVRLLIGEVDNGSQNGASGPSSGPRERKVQEPQGT